MSKTKSPLSNIQNLYVLQVELWDILEKDLTSDERKEARKRLREFSALLKRADWRYMGGEDVYETLRAMQKEVASKLTRSAKSKRKVVARKVAKRKPAKKLTKKKATKKTNKKKVTKRKPAKKKTALKKRARKAVKRKK